MPLLDLATQDMFELMWFHQGAALPGMRSQDGGWIVYHTAKWCKPCQRMNKQAIVDAAEARGLTVWLVDQDVNDYTTGYCGVRSIPTFQFYTPRQVGITLQPRDTEDVLQWISTL
jgi:hypothetical protein